MAGRVMARLGGLFRRALGLLVVEMILLPTAALAEPPAVKLMSAPLVTPSAAWTYYGSGTTHTTGVIGWTSGNRPTEIKELARALNRGGALTGSAYADRVYEYVRNNIDVEYRFGLAKGARGALIDQSGTPFDQAHLMVELLREGGVSASYQVGTISPSAAQFAEWTGLTDAKAACQFLADGGIPATVNGASSCSGLSGSLSSVTLGHIWASAAGKLYDPSFKKHVFKTGIDLAAALGCGNASATTCGSTIAGLVPTPTLRSGTTNVYQITSVPETSINAQLKIWAVNLQNYIQNYNAANNTVLSVEDVIGGKLIDLMSPATSSTLPYGSSVQYSWSGDIPDQFRTALRVQFDNLDQTLFVDELTGKRLRIWGNGTQVSGQPNSYTYTRNAALYVEYKPLAKSARTNSTDSDAVLTLTASHPYAANGGGYMDETLQQNAYFDYSVNVLTILNGWGNASQSSISHFAALQSRDRNNLLAEDVSSSNHLWFRRPASDPVEGYGGYCFGISPSSTPVPDSGCFQQHHATVAATWLAQASRMTAMAAQIGGGLEQLHHSLGYLLSGEAHKVTVINGETGLSANSKANVAADRQAIFLEAVAGLSRLEGSVLEQEFDAWDGGSAVSYLVKSSSSSGKGIATLWVNSGNVTQALNALTNYSAARKATIQSYVSTGYNLMVPQNGYLGSYTYCCHTLSINTNATVGFTTAGDRAAYLIDGRFKGSAAGSSSPSQEALRSVEVMNHSLRVRNAYGVNQADGSFTLSPPPDLVTGAGGSPLSLAFQRHYSSSADIGALDDTTGFFGHWEPYEIALSGKTGQTVSDLGGGWSHNFDISAKMGSDGFKGLGKDSARDASAAIAGMFTVYKLNSGTSSFAAHMATTYTTNWWMARLQNNVVVVKRPPATSVFTRLPDDSTFSAQPGSSDVLTQSGNRVFQTWSQEHGLASLYSYGGTGFTLTDGAGQVTQFSYLAANQGNYVYAPSTTIAVPMAITSAQGVKISFANKGMNTVYTDCTWQIHNCLSGVSNSLGRSLTLDTSTVSDDNGRQISFRTERNLSGSIVSETTNSAVFWVPTKFTVTGPGGLVTSYDYVPNPLAAIERPFARITRWYTPSSPTTPYITTDFDSLYRVRGVTDSLNHRGDYYVAGLYGPENQKPAAVKDPLGNVTTSLFDVGGKQTAQTDALGRTSEKVYDNADRLIREIMPEGDAVEKLYDIRSNVIRACRIAKGRVDWSTLNTVTEQTPQCNAGAGDLITTTTYMEGPAVWPCANPKTCNKPSYVIDPRGNRIDYFWSATHGQILTETKPADANGVHPVTTYGYTPFTGVDGATFYLLTSKQEKIDASNTTTTTWAYNGSAQKFTLKEQVVDSGGLALRTCFKFDSTGNLISKTEPRAGLASCP